MVDLLVDRSVVEKADLWVDLMADLLVDQLADLRADQSVGQ